MLEKGSLDGQRVWKRVLAAVLAGLKQLLDVGANVAGVVLTQVDIQKARGYGYGAGGYYYEKYRKYYTQ